MGTETKITGGKMESRKIEIYWTKEKGIHYRNDGREIPYEELMRSIHSGERQVRVDITWAGGPENGPLPTSIFAEMQRRKSELEGMTVNSK